MESEHAGYPLKAPAFLMRQPLGDFYVTRIPARVLLDTAYSDRLQAELEDGDTYRLEGSQRQIAEPRLRQIGKYIDTAESAFPNAIILAANFKRENGLFEEDAARQWSVEPHGDSGLATITIKGPWKLAAVIDGQHRLFGFNFAASERLEFPLVCSVYFGLPKPFQAFLFATINSTQKPVDKSLTYELFGYNVEDEPPEAWAPDKLAVYLSRRLNIEADSPLKGRIVIAAENSIVDTRSEARAKGRWMVSMAAIVEGILALFSTNPQNDSYRMHHQRVPADRRRSLLGTDVKRKPPLRDIYMANNDKLIYTLVKNYLRAVDVELWSGSPEKSYIQKTVGIQAIFDLLKALAPEAISQKDISEDFFRKRLSKSKGIDFGDDFFQASGTGRKRIRGILEICAGLKELGELSQEEQEKCGRLLGRPVRSD